MAPLALAQGVELELASGAEASVAGDPDLVRVLMRNLIDNAVRYCGAQGTVRVAVERKGAEVVFSVTDQGPGIPPEQRAWVWERFHRVPGSSGSGSGLGLSIVRRIAELHGARAELATAEGGRGLTVQVRFPAAPV